MVCACVETAGRDTILGPDSQKGDRTRTRRHITLLLPRTDRMNASNRIGGKDVYKRKTSSDACQPKNTRRKDTSKEKRAHASHNEKE